MEIERPPSSCLARFKVALISGGNFCLQMRSENIVRNSAGFFPSFGRSRQLVYRGGSQTDTNMLSGSALRPTITITKPFSEWCERRTQSDVLRMSM